MKFAFDDSGHIKLDAEKMPLVIGADGGETPYDLADSVERFRGLEAREAGYRAAVKKAIDALGLDLEVDPQSTEALVTKIKAVAEQAGEVETLREFKSKHDGKNALTQDDVDRLARQQATQIAADSEAKLSKISKENDGLRSAVADAQKEVQRIALQRVVEMQLPNLKTLQREADGSPMRSAVNEIVRQVESYRTPAGHWFQFTGKYDPSTGMPDVQLLDSEGNTYTGDDMKPKRLDAFLKNDVPKLARHCFVQQQATKVDGFGDGTGAKPDMSKFNTRDFMEAATRQLSQAN